MLKRGSGIENIVKCKYCLNGYNDYDLISNKANDDLIEECFCLDSKEEQKVIRKIIEKRRKDKLLNEL